jgi:hypothetical protein
MQQHHRQRPPESNANLCLRSAQPPCHCPPPRLPKPRSQRRDSNTELSSQSKMLSRAKKHVQAILCYGRRIEEHVDFEMMQPPARHVQPDTIRYEAPTKPLDLTTPPVPEMPALYNDFPVTPTHRPRNVYRVQSTKALFAPEDARATLPSQRSRLPPAQISETAIQEDVNADKWHRKFPRSDSLTIIGEAK